MTGRTVLLIEDNPDDTFLTERTLKNSKLADEVVVAKDGVEALEYLFGQSQAESHSLLSFVLLDLNLPRLSGLAVLRRIRAEKSTKLLPVIVLTASQDERDMVDCYSNGANGYIQKPMNSRKLIFAIEDLHVAPLASNRTPMTRTASAPD